MTPADAASPMTFDFAAGGLRRCVLELAAGSEDATIRVEAAGDSGCLHVRAGQVVAAQLGGFTGVRAFARLMLCGPGRWTRAQAQAEVAAELAGSTAELIGRIERILVDSAPPPAPAERETVSIARAAGDEALTPEDLDRAFNAAAAAGDDPLMTMRATLLPPQPGERIGRCVLRRVLGEGASSIVYLAHHTAFDIDVVVKVLIPAASGADAAALTANEARILARLNHPAILRVFDYDDGGRHPHLVMEHIPGGSLAERIGEGVDPELAVTVARQAAKALLYAQSLIGLVHGDLKPANILLADDGRIRLIDFGIAAVHDGKERFSTAVRSQVRGTPAYLAPELVERPAALSWASDCYALGATLYHALAGRTLYRHDDPLQLMLLHRTGDFLPLHLARPGLDPRLIEVVHRCLRLRPEDRFPTAGALLAAVEELSGGSDDGTMSFRVNRQRTTLWQHVARVWRRA